ncbi:phosphoglycerate mutase family protein [Alteromonas aestuariivivens]|uniref:Phosphoglycerate mutase family protein n=1 Tax=Alteromonas aestuariivivens TaxID=1938339 RepID=A0A3D8M7F2_9ALTE|nr:histidine phosphatase family protein [Alteromonas aestuariivivens]RDV25553.1 phosphoglycerate mutase family protein [Alteromonas aestuariivivens]
MEAKEILLIRHGRPKSATNEKVNATGFAHWVRDYNRAQLHPKSKAGHRLDLSEYYIMSSDLKRAQLSASQYSDQPIHEISALLREMDIPRYRLPFRLRAWTWVVINRAIWFAGVRGPFESFSAAKVRANYAANLLEARAETHRKVVVFGHGLSNRYIRRNLERRGWKVLSKDHGYWGLNRLQLPVSTD